MRNYQELPPQVTVGDNFSVDAEWAEWSPDDYDFTLAFQKADGTYNFSLNGVVNEGDSTFTMDPTTSNAIKPGQYYYQIFATSKEDSSRTQIARGGVFFMEDFTKVPNITQAQRTYAALNDLMEGKASDDIGTITINGKTLSVTPMKDIIALHTYFAGLVQQEQNKKRLRSGQGSRRVVRVTFNDGINATFNGDTFR